MDREAWSAMVHRVAKRRTRLKRLSTHSFRAMCPVLTRYPWAWGASHVPPVVKNPPASAGDIRVVGLIPGSGRSPGGGHGNPLQYSGLENLMGRGAWWAYGPQGGKKSDKTGRTA